MKTVLIIPALNEEESIGFVLGEIRRDLYSRIFVVDNGSTDRTSDVAAAQGAIVLHEPRRGYGAACLRAIAELPADTDVVVFMDGDGSDVPAEAELLLRPIREGKADLVIGSRPLGVAEPGSLAPHQRWGNRLATFLLRLRCGHRYTDLGPFRAIRAVQLARLGMTDPNYGWTVEMQMKAALKGLRVVEVPVSYRRRRNGTSKVSGNPRGSLAAGAKILWTIARLAVQ
jgi:glycosyltransferase involved in cell wall biosynthesis